MMASISTPLPDRFDRVDLPISRHQPCVMERHEFLHNSRLTELNLLSSNVLNMTEVNFPIINSLSQAFPIYEYTVEN
jgi:hypothetical protein